MGYCYIEQNIDGQLTYSVGYSMDGDTENWLPDITTDSREVAAERVCYLNGGALPQQYQNVFYVLICCDRAMPKLMGPMSLERVTGHARKQLALFKKHDDELPKDSKARNNCRVYLMRWKHGYIPRIENFMAEDLDAPLSLDFDGITSPPEREAHWIPAHVWVSGVDDEAV
jgi:hypothetical protein